MNLCLCFSDGQVPGLVETSNNVASVKLNETFHLVSFARSAVDRELEAFRHSLARMAREHGARVEWGPELPGWAPNSKSHLLLGFGRFEVMLLCDGVCSLGIFLVLVRGF